MPDGGSMNVIGLSQAAEDAAAAQSAVGPAIRIAIAETFDDIVRCMVIRGAVWLGEDDTAAKARYAEQFDRNDTLSTHLIVWIGDEPVGTMRLRWIGDHVRFERLAVRSQYRSYPLLLRLARFAFAFARAKGFRFASALAREGTQKFWVRRGARIVAGPLPYHGADTYAMLRDLAEIGGPHQGLGGGVPAVGHPDFERAMDMAEADLMDHSGDLKVAA